MVFKCDPLLVWLDQEWTVITMWLFLVKQTVMVAVELEDLMHWTKHITDFRITPVKSGFTLIRVTLGFTGICSELTLG